MTGPPKRQRGLRILARDTEYVRTPASPDEVQPERAVVPQPDTAAPAPTAVHPPSWHAFRRIDLRLPIDPDLLQAARALAAHAALPPDVVLQLARRRTVARFRAAIAAGSIIDLCPAPPPPARLRLTATFPDGAAQAIAARYDPLATGRSYGLVAPLVTLLSDELERIVVAAAAKGSAAESVTSGRDQSHGA